MAKGSTIYQDAPPSEYLTDDEKNQYSDADTVFDILEIDQDTAKFGPMWVNTIMVKESGEIRKLSLAMTERRDPKFQAWSDWLDTHPGERIEDMVYKRGQTKKGQTWSDITDAN